MRSVVVWALSRLLLRLLHQDEVEKRLWEITHAPRPFRPRGGNLEAALARRATEQSAEYIERRMTGVPSFKRRFDLMKHALSIAGHGLYLEFGVEDGESIRFIAAHVLTEVHGFDSFLGLPEPWTSHERKGAMSMAGKLPPVPSNVRLHVGWFDDVLPDFVAQHATPVAFLHVDCDLYSSTRSVFKHLAGQIGPGTVIQFDEYFNYSGWRDHEFKAFQEFAAERDLRYEYLGYVVRGYSVALLIR